MVRPLSKINDYLKLFLFILDSRRTKESCCTILLVAMFPPLLCLVVGASVPVRTDQCSVSVASKVSHTECVLNQNYGCFNGNNSMWVSQGCVSLLFVLGACTAAREG